METLGLDKIYKHKFFIYCKQKMVNQTVLEYFRVNKGHYKLEDLKKKILSSGYSQKDIDDALMQLEKETKGNNPPSVSSTINKLNKTNIVETKPVAKPAVQNKIDGNMIEQKPKKSKKWLWIILGIVLLLLILGGVAVWLFFPEWFGL